MLLFLAAIATAVLLSGIVRASQLDPIFFTPFPKSLKPLLFYQFGYFEESAKLYREAYKSASENTAGSSQTIVTARLSGDWNTAKEAALVLMRRNSDDLLALKTLAEVALHENDLVAATDLSTRIIGLNDVDAEGLMLAAMVATRKHSYGDAIGFLNLALRTGRSGNVFTFLDALEITGRLRGLPEPPLCLLAHFYRYLRIYDTAKGQSAVEAAESAIVAGDHQPEAYLTVGIALEKQGRRQRALEAFQKALQVDPSYGMAYRWAGVVYSKAGDRSHRYLMRQAAFLTNPSDHLFRDELYSELTERKEWFHLAKMMQKSIGGDERDIVAHSYAAYAYRQLGDEAEADHHLRQTLLFEPRGPKALDTKAWALEQQTGRLDEAEQLLKRSILLDSDRPAPYRALARLHQQQGCAEQAFEAMEKAWGIGGREEREHLTEFCSYYQYVDMQLASACFKRFFGTPQ